MANGGIGRGRGGNQHGVSNNSPTGDIRPLVDNESNDFQEIDGTKTHLNTHAGLSKEVNSILPPDPPSLLPQRANGAAFGIQKQVVDTRQELKLSIEFPLSKSKNGNDIVLFYKRFMTVIFASSKDLQLLKWEGSTENPIMAAADIAYDETTIGQFYSGMKMQNDRNRMISYSRISCQIHF